MKAKEQTIFEEVLAFMLQKEHFRILPLKLSKRIRTLR